MKTSSLIKIYLREFTFLARGIFSTKHPVLAHVIPMRCCNLSCAYCNEYDDFSEPVPTEIMFKRLDKLAELKTTAIIIKRNFFGLELYYGNNMHPSANECVALTDDEASGTL